MNLGKFLCVPWPSVFDGHMSFGGPLNTKALMRFKPISALQGRMFCSVSGEHWRIQRSKSKGTVWQWNSRGLQWGHPALYYACTHTVWEQKLTKQKPRRNRVSNNNAETSRAATGVVLPWSSRFPCRNVLMHLWWPVCSLWLWQSFVTAAIRQACWRLFMHNLLLYLFLLAFIPVIPFWF